MRTLTGEAVHCYNVDQDNQLCYIGGSNYWNKMIDLLELFENDNETEAIVMIGEIGGSMEIEAANYIKEI